MTVYSRFEAKVLQLLREVSNEFGVAFNLITIDICQGWASLAENQYANIINLCIGAKRVFGCRSQKYTSAYSLRFMTLNHIHLKIPPILIPRTTPFPSSIRINSPHQHAFSNSQKMNLRSGLATDSTRRSCT